jgi:hypothetical protein
MIMQNNRYNIYINSILQLARQLVIKSVDSADLQNKYITLTRGASAVDTTAPETWKYYMNLAGEYHFTDEAMYVVSSDTLETILFSVDNLKLHRATARDHAIGTRKYRELVSKYPKQETLIRGILTPVDKVTAIAADDGTILYWPSDLVESNEYSLISKIENWIAAYKLQYENTQYSVSENLYATTSHALMYMSLIPAIINFRLEACKTNEAHSYHVREYLASHDGLDKYLPALSLRQAHFLYRNIPYIQRNAGKQEIFDLLVENFLTARNIPLDEYVAKHVSTDMPNSLLPDVVFRRVPLNYTPSHLNDITFDIDAMFYKEADLARDNSLYLQDYLEAARHSFSISLADTVDTKLLGSDVVDYSGSERYLLADLLLSHWLYFSHIGLYGAVISSTNAATGEGYLLRADEAFLFMWYLFHKSHGITLEYIPDILAERVVRDSVVSIDEMLSVVEDRWRDHLRPVLVTAQSLLPVLSRSISVDAFYNQVSLICSAMNKQQLLVANEQHTEVRAQITNAINRLYMDRICSPATPTELYDTWLSSRNIYLSTLTKDQFAQMYEEILKNGTGLNGKNGITVRDIQKAMLNLVAALSSYSIQFTSSCNTSAVIATGDAAVRLGDVDVSGAATLVAPSHRVDILNGRETVKSGITINPGDGAEITVSATLKDRFYIELETLVGETIGGFSSLQTYKIELGVKLETPVKPIPYENGVVNVPGMDLFLQLSSERQNAILEYVAGQKP